MVVCRVLHPIRIGYDAYRSADIQGHECGLFLSELKRRNVLRTAALYIGAVWALAQGISQLGPSVGAPEWFTRWFLVAARIGFPFAMLFSWFYEWTPHGFQRESDVAQDESVARATGKKLDRWMIAVLSVAVLLLSKQFVLHKEANRLPLLQ